MAIRRKGENEKLTGAQKAAIVLMSIDEETSSRIFSMMTEEEIKEISHCMSSLGPVSSESVETLMGEFINQFAQGRGVVGNMELVEKILEKALGKEKVATIMEDISGPVGRTTWDKLNNVNEDILAAYLKNEYPQTAALVLSKIRPAQAAKVLSAFPEDFAMEVMLRMISMEPVKKEVLSGIERTLQSEFMSNLAATKKNDTYEAIAEIFNNFDRNAEGKFMELLESKDAESAERIRELMFTFDDLQKIDNAGIQAIIRKVDKDKLAIALKGANEKLREMFFSNMSERAAKILQEDMESKGPVRIRDVDEAQSSIVVVAKELADSGEIIISDGSEDDQLIY
ncbi:MAG: flagellar motor switch protein FliG [Proteobacteria bacterium]|nr:flagellar motor switch protein FliG [Pseudomonadota bacterium]